MDARREARRRRILQNSEDRLKKVMGVQSSARKVDDELDDEEQNNENEEAVLGFRGSESIQTTHSETTSPIENKEEDIKEEDNQEKFEENIIEDKQDTDSTPEAATLLREEEELTVSRKKAYDATLLYRILLVSMLAVCLVTICTLKLVSNTMKERICKTSFLPYFVVVEAFLLCLFPIRNSGSNSSMILLALKLSGLTEATIQNLLYSLSLMSRMSQDFCWFIFTVVLANCTFEYFL